jgi:hypothetical protein
MKLRSSVGALLLVTAAAMLLMACPPPTSPETFTIQVTSSYGTCTLNPDKASYLEGESVTITAYPDDGFGFLNWSGSISGDSNPQTFTVTGDMDITANYVS